MNINGKLTILSYRSDIFQDRREAGRLLASELDEYRGQKVVVLGIPRGGIVVAVELAKQLEADLDVILSRKLRSPLNEELAMGSVSENGKVFLNDEVISQLGVNEDFIKRETEIQIAEIERRSKLIRREVPKIFLEKRVVIVTDDGVATGATFQAALWSARQEKPVQLVAAIPVGSEEAIKNLASQADLTLCLRAPRFFSAVGQFYRYFNQIEDEEFLQILKENRTGGTVSHS
jgi:predicted phosphoribosyltransferase